MQTDAATPAEYLLHLPEERQEVMTKLRQVILSVLPEGFSETISYGMIGYVVPKSLYPKGYHCNPELPLPFMSIASQKNYIALYHSGVYANPELYTWFTTEYIKQCGKKPDMGKSCIRFKKTDQIPYALIGELVAKVPVGEWISIYESARENRRR